MKGVAIGSPLVGIFFSFVVLVVLGVRSPTAVLGCVRAHFIYWEKRGGGGFGHLVGSFIPTDMCVLSLGRGRRCCCFCVLFR